MNRNVKYIVSYSKSYSYYGVYEIEHTCFDSKDEAIRKFHDHNGFIEGKTYNCNYGGANDEEPVIDVYITRIELEIEGRRIISDLLRTDDDKRPYQTVVDTSCTYECPSYHRCPYSHMNEKADCQRVQKINKEFIEDLDAYFGSF